MYNKIKFLFFPKKSKDFMQLKSNTLSCYTASNICAGSFEFSISNYYRSVQLESTGI